MKALIDTSVLVAAHVEGHPHFTQSQQLLMRLDDAQTLVCIHTLAEIYSSLTRLPPPFRIPPALALGAADRIARKYSIVTLTEEECRAALTKVSGLELPGSVIYDALILQAALRAGAETLYTWNTKHFARLNPEIKIATP